MSSLHDFFDTLEADVDIIQPFNGHLMDGVSENFMADDELNYLNEQDFSFADFEYGEEPNYVYGDQNIQQNEFCNVRSSKRKEETSNGLETRLEYRFERNTGDLDSNVDQFNDCIDFESLINSYGLKNETGIITSLISHTNNPKPRKGTLDKCQQLVDFNYEDLEITQEIEDCTLINLAANTINETTFDFILSNLKERKLLEEERICMINRVRYVRHDLAALNSLHPHVQYQYNRNFSFEKPYEPEFVRVQIDPANSLPYNETRSGLCPYCERLVFKNLKTSTYAQHLSLSHGIQTDNYLTPNPFLYGCYRLKKSNTNRKTKARITEKNGVICPACLGIIETECSKTTASEKPLNNYLRHFRENHRKCRDKDDPVKYFKKVSTETQKYLRI